MIAPELRQAADAVATGAPEVWGYGYADTQTWWRYDPAVSLGRETAQRLLQLVGEHALDGTVLLVGAGHRGGLHRLLASIAGATVTVEERAATLEALAAERGDASAPATFVAGDPLEVVDRVRAASATFDVLLVAAGRDRAGMAALLRAYAPLVRAGGLVAFCDDSHSLPLDAVADGVDRLALELERDVLAPAGVVLRRIGGAHAVHWFAQTAASRASIEPWEGARPSDAEGPAFVGAAEGHTLHRWRGFVWAIPDGVTFDLRDVVRGAVQPVLTAPDERDLCTLLAAYRSTSPRLEASRDALRQGDVDGARALVTAARDEHPQLASGLLASLQRAPLATTVLVDAGTLELFGPRPALGAALLRRALARDMLDGALLTVLAHAYRSVLGDAPAAVDLAAEARAALRYRKVGEVCHGKLRGHALWKSPKLLARIHGVIEVGAHRGALSEAWNALEIRDQLYLEPNPASFAALEQALARAGNDRAIAMPCAAAAEAGSRPLRIPSDDAHASLAATHPLARLGPDEIQRQSIDVSCVTLDELAAAGRFDPHRYNLLFVETGGTELDVLRGATRHVLPHVDVVCVAVCLAPHFDGAPLPLEVQTWMRTLGGVGRENGDDGFALCSFEVAADPRCGQAVFRRIRRRDPMAAAGSAVPSQPRRPT